ncbi:MAG: OmpP1/FadL family transporter [Bryobacteraceae bacterium]
MVSSPALSGSAFAITELGARAAGMGTAFTSIADDGSALYYNPAGIAFQPGMRLQMDMLVVVGLFRFFPADPLPGTVVPEKGFHGSIKPKFIPVASMYLTKEIRPNWTFGFGVFTPFGLSANFTNFNDSDPALTKFTGRFAGTRARLESFWFQPTIAHKFNDNHSVAAGVAWVHTHLFIESSFLNPLDDALDFGREAAKTVFPGVDKEAAARSIARLLPEGRSRIAGTSNRPGFNAGYLFKHEGSKTNIGLNWRSAVTNKLKGKASFAFGTDFPLRRFVADDLLFKAFPNQDITGSFTTPAMYALGVSNRRFFNSTISFDFRLQDFKRFANVPLNFSQTRANNDDIRTPAERRLVFDFRNSYHLAFGVERPLNERMTMRAGYLFDRSPVVDKAVGPLFPDANRNGLTVGGSFKRGNREFTFFYEAMNFVERTTAVPANAHQFTNGRYSNFAHVAGLGLRILPGENK